MIVYSSREQPAVTAVLLQHLNKLLRQISDTQAGRHSDVQELLIEFGRLEAALVDALFTDRDGLSRLARTLRRISLELGHLLRLSWQAGPVREREAWLARLQESFTEVLSLEDLPRTVQLRVPEGYAYYALYPEAYLAAAERFYRQTRPARVVCLGIRSIGTSLSGVAGASLEALGCRVRSYTLRPRGHPFERRPLLGPDLVKELQAWADGYFLIIDEGPGLSGSSLGGTAEVLSRLGIPDSRIVFLPSWEPDGSQLVSALARERWRRHRKFSVSFEELWVEQRRLTRELAEGTPRDLSGGKWRALLYENEAAYPAVQPQHERRKYLCPAGGHNGPFPQSRSILFKFAGLGRYGQATRERAERLAEAGFSPPVLGLHNGFLITPFVSGRPLTQVDVDKGLLNAIARYLAFLRRTYTTEDAADYEALMAMMTINIAEGLGPLRAAQLDRLESCRAVVGSAPTVALDGRMLPHEWLQTADGFLKTDGVDHHDDHFFPGCQDITWDIAGCAVEFALRDEALKYLVESYQRLTGDRELFKRLSFYRIAYAAYRLGYAALAVSALGRTPEARRFAVRVDRYKAVLRQALQD